MDMCYVCARSPFSLTDPILAWSECSVSLASLARRSNFYSVLKGLLKFACESFFTVAFKLHSLPLQMCEKIALISSVELTGVEGWE